MHGKNKTIFVSIPNITVYRNFCLFPGSVMDLLAREKDLRVVVLMKKVDLPRFRPRFGASNFIIETYDGDETKNFLQRIFFFFFSYLIFTETTKLISSYGVRADKPRPLVKYWNYPIKWVLGNILGKSKYLTEKLVPGLYFKIFNDRRFGQFFDKYNPDLLFLPNVCIWPSDLEFLAEAKRRNIRTVGAPGNWDHLSKYFIPFKPDKLLVWARQVKYEAMKYQNYGENTVKMVGAPQIDFMVKKENIISRSEFLKKIGFQPEDRIINFCSQGPYSLDGADIVDMILKWIKKGEFGENVRVIIRPHPAAIFEKEKYRPFVGNPLVYIDAVDNWGSVPNVQNFLNVINHSDVLVTTYSSIATEASILDRPTIIASFDGYKTRSIYQSVRRHKNFTHFQYLLPIGAISVAESAAELLDFVKMYLNDPAKNMEKRKKMCHEVFGQPDGKNAGRILEEIKGFV